MVDDLLDKIADPGCDPVGLHVRRQLPPRVLTLILGVPVSEAQQFRLWVDTLTGFDTEPDARHAAEETVHEYVEGLPWRSVGRRRATIFSRSWFTLTTMTTGWTKKGSIT